ncbi:MAG: hypothetical protein M1830_009481 [Pleopsidium flavum]|nr:MAG: hypothetical protein M1830_009481 [Pleopsidium flavum]
MTDRHSRRRPFSAWMKRLANLKNSSSDNSPNASGKGSNGTSPPKSKKSNGVKNSPYPISPQSKPLVASSGNGHLNLSTNPSGRSIGFVSPTQSRQSLPASSDGQQPPTISNQSAAPTLSTNPDTVSSDATRSKTGTSTTVGGAMSSNGGGEGSTFSSPAPSVRSMTTTLTTIQSAAPSNLIPGGGANQAQNGVPGAPHSHNSQYNSHVQSHSHFSHQFPSSPPASAVPSHLAPQTGGGHPATYNTATANNLLTDNASILTLASSSKRRRRNSLDTNASVRALAPSSLFGGSRESLPLSVLSASIGDHSSVAASGGLYQGRPSIGGIPNPERASVYSSTGVAPALSSERNSYYAGKQVNTVDGASVRSGLVGHGRNDSITGSIGGIGGISSPLASPRDLAMAGRMSRRSSGWGEVSEENSDDEERDEGRHDGEKVKENAR